MHYFSTNGRSPRAGFREAVLRGQPDDKGLYFPSEIPDASRVAAELSKLDNTEIAFRIIKPFVGGDIPDERLREICRETISFEVPLVALDPDISVLELFHGPTLAFKDVGARFMSRCLGALSPSNGQKTVVVVATSGDTGGAVAAGFHGVDNVEVIILYPSGKVSRIQELQLTTLGGNVTTLELRGTFDDCQALAKEALSDRSIAAKANVTSANSINIARWLPQQFYYFLALKQWDGPPPVVSVPSGNFGNLAAGMLAREAGLSIKRFVAACNANDVVPRFLETGYYTPRDSIATLSNAMDVGSPSNFVRITQALGMDIGSIARSIGAVVVSDDETARTMRRVHKEFGYTLDPHGAVGFAALERSLEPGEKGFFLETAHPIKFDSVAQIIGSSPETPPWVGTLLTKEKHSIPIENDYEAVREIILSKI